MSIKFFPRKIRRDRRAPLRKITEIIRAAANEFDLNRVRLECGHEVSTHGQVKARCKKCLPLRLDPC